MVRTSKFWALVARLGKFKEKKPFKCSKEMRMLLAEPYGAQLINEETDYINRLAHG